MRVRVNVGGPSLLDNGQPVGCPSWRLGYPNLGSCHVTRGMLMYDSKYICPSNRMQLVDLWYVNLDPFGTYLPEDPNLGGPVLVSTRYAVSLSRRMERV